jgi:transcriptional regulator with XRE-family HTH domain
MMFADQQTLPAIIKPWLGQRSVRQGAAALGVADNTLHAWLRGTSFPPRTRIPSLAAALGVSVEALTRMVAHARRRRVVAGGARSSCPGRNQSPRRNPGRGGRISGGAK